MSIAWAVLTYCLLGHISVFSHSGHLPNSNVILPAWVFATLGVYRIRMSYCLLGHISVFATLGVYRIRSQQHELVWHISCLGISRSHYRLQLFCPCLRATFGLSLGQATRQLIRHREPPLSGYAELVDTAWCRDTLANRVKRWSGNDFAWCHDTLANRVTRWLGKICHLWFGKSMSMIAWDMYWSHIKHKMNPITP